MLAHPYIIQTTSIDVTFCCHTRHKPSRVAVRWGTVLCCAVRYWITSRMAHLTNSVTPQWIEQIYNFTCDLHTCVACVRACVCIYTEREASCLKVPPCARVCVCVYTTSVCASSKQTTWSFYKIPSRVPGEINSSEFYDLRVLCCFFLNYLFVSHHKIYGAYVLAADRTNWLPTGR